MLNLSGTTRVLVATTPVDLCGSFNRPYGLVIDHPKGDPLSGNLFLFTNRRRKLPERPPDQTPAWAADRAPDRESLTAWLAAFRRAVAANPAATDKAEHLATVYL
jgi:hypothetical protein